MVGSQHANDQWLRSSMVDLNEFKISMTIIAMLDKETSPRHSLKNENIKIAKNDQSKIYSLKDS